MALSKESGLIAREADAAPALEGHISLLWAYQLRREHALLLTRVADLAATVQSEDEATQTNTLNLDLKTANDRINGLENQVNSHGVDLQAVLGKVAGSNGLLAEIQLQLTENETQQRLCNGELRAAQENLMTQVEQLRDAKTTNMEAKLKEQQDQIQRLQEKMRKLEAQITKPVEKDVTVIRDSIENLAPPNFRTPKLVRNSNVSRKINGKPHGFSHAKDLLQEIEEEDDSNLRTMHPYQREETESTDFDLDAGVATMSYARQLRGRGLEQDSMQMLAEPPLLQKQQLSRIEEHIDLQQGCAQAWEQYFRKGRDLIKRKEAVIVRAFVAGILDPQLRARCQHWLDSRVWSWVNVESFSTHLDPPEGSPEPASTAEPTPEPPPHTRGLAVDGKGGQSQGVSRELYRLLEHQDRHRVGSLAISQSPEADGRRRSQRIRTKVHTASQQAKEPQQAKEIQKAQATRQATVIQEADDTRQPKSVEMTSKRPVQAKGERPTRLRNPRRQATKDRAVADAGERRSVQLQLIKNNATEPKQVVRRQNTRTNTDVRHTTEAVKPAPHVLPGRGEDRGLQLEDISDRKLREQLRKLHHVFPGEKLEICQEALVAKLGNHEEACRWIVERTVKWRKTISAQNSLQRPTKLKSKKQAARPSTPTRINDHADAIRPAPPDTEARNPQPPQTPEAQMRIGRVSYKRKADPMELANMKRARLAKRKRAPAPEIPILPWSDTE